MNNYYEIFISNFFFIFNCRSKSSKTRLIDLAVEFTSPDSGAFYKLPNDIVVDFKVKNFGPDTISPKDTLQYQLSLGGHLNTLKFYIFDQSLFPNDSITLKDTISFWEETDTFSKGGLTSLRFATFVLVKELDEGSGRVLRGYGDNSDNNPRLRLNWKSKFSNIFDVQILSSIVYPNPSFGIVNLDSKKEIKEFRLIDLNGKCILRKDKLSNRYLRLRMHNLKRFFSFYNFFIMMEQWRILK